MRFLPLLALSALVLACRRTHVEVFTEVGPYGGGTRTVTVRSFDDGVPADFPDNLRLPRGPFSTLEDGPGLWRAIASFASPEQAAAPFEFTAPGVERTAHSTTGFAATDWVLFQHYAYQETVRDVIDPQDVQAALDETGDTLAQLADATLRSLIGDGYDETLLHARFREELRRMARELSFVAWRELQQLGRRSDAQAGLSRALQQVCALLRRYQLELRPEWFERWLTGEASSGPPAELQDALVDWIAAGLRPAAPQGGRALAPPNLHYLLFEGPFEREFQSRLEARFGGGAGVAAWRDRTLVRIFGMFGQMSIFSRDQLDFTLRVKMPGTLLRSNGYLGVASSFVEFPAEAIYPDGAGLACESLIWDFGALGALRARIAADNEAAVAWMNLAGRGEGPERTPHGRLAQLLRTCVQEQSLDALDEAAAAGGEFGQLAGRAAAFLRAQEPR